MSLCRPFARPLYVMLKPAGARCNLACTYCYYTGKDSLYEEKMPHCISDDLLERFRHNGVIRRCLSADPLGDVMTFDGENVFRIDYPAFEKEAVWNWNNCPVVAVAHKVNKEDLADNYVLNAGDNRLNEVAKSVRMPRADAADDISVYVDGNRRLRTSEPVKSLRVYSLDGRLLQNDAALPEGIYVVVCVSLDGVPHPCKVAVR